MNIRHLQSFLALFEEPHFGRAAQRLGMTQPSLSAQIRQLEEEIGVVLVDRSTRHVELTPAGRALADGARSVLRELTRTVATTRDVAQGRTGRLSIGSVGAGFNGIIAPVLRRLRGELPDVQITLRQFPSSPHQVHAIGERSIDVGILRSAPHAAGVTAELLYEESFIVYLPAKHPLARSEAPLRLAQLSGERFVSWPRELGPEFHDTITRACLAAGFSPAPSAIGYSTEAQLSLVAAQYGVSFQAASNASPPSPQISPDQRHIPSRSDRALCARSSIALGARGRGRWWSGGPVLGPRSSTSCSDGHARATARPG